MPVGTIRLYRPDPASISESEECGHATFTVRYPTAPRIHVAATGEIDALNSRALGRYVERHTGVSKQMILDLRAVDFFGSQGFTALYYISVHCMRSDVDWMIIGGPPVQRVLAICDPNGELPFVADLESAAARLDRSAQYRRRTASAG